MKCGEQGRIGKNLFIAPSQTALQQHKLTECQSISDPQHPAGAELSGIHQSMGSNVPRDTRPSKEVCSKDMEGNLSLFLT